MKKLIFLGISAFTVFWLITGRPNVVSFAQDATEGGQDVRQKVKEKVELVRKNPKAYIGTITDKTDETIQIKTQSGEILQVAVDQKTSYVKLNKSTEKVKFSDLAIGDFIVAMGFTDTSNVLAAKRVLLTSPPKPAQQQIAKGVVVSLNKTSLKISGEISDGEMVIEPVKNALVTEFTDTSTKSKFSQIDEGDTIIAVGTFEEDVLSTRRIQIISRAPSPSPTTSPTPTSKEKPAQ